MHHRPLEIERFRKVVVQGLPLSIRAKNNTPEKRDAIAIGRRAGELSRAYTYHGSGELSCGTKAFIAVKGARENRADFVSEQLYQY